MWVTIYDTQWFTASQRQVVNAEDRMFHEVLPVLPYTSVLIIKQPDIVS